MLNTSVPSSNKASPWHRGERAIHERMGTAAQMENIGQRVIRDYLPEQHRQFYEQIPFMVLGGVDDTGEVWASILEGEPGFMRSPSPQTLQINALPSAGDPLRAVLRQKHTAPAIGMLGIELHSRRRNRVNGKVVAQQESGFSFTVDQSFGNCPQYIQKRQFRFARQLGLPFSGEIETINGLDEAARAGIAQADTFFVASHFLGDEEHPEPMVDVSHRGGKPGFVRVEGNTLTIPDFAGNLHFNTFGNLLLNPRAGLLFVDFTTGDMLQITGTAEVQFNDEKIAAFQGAERQWTFTVSKLVRRKNALALRWTFEEFSPNSLMTGSWQEAQAKLQAEQLHNTWRTMRVVKIVEEARNIRSFYLKPEDGFALANFSAGQHLPIRLRLPVEDKALLRTDTRTDTRNYTLSCAPSDGVYRLSIKREGRFSQHMHDSLREGDTLEARSPQGEFVINASEKRPAVLLAGGIGVTPMLAMLRHIVFEGVRKRRVRPTTFFYAVRNEAERAFNEELAELVQLAKGAVRVIRVSSAPEAGATLGKDFEVQGRIDLALLKASLPFDDYDFYLCGPQPFMQTLYDGLRSLRVMDESIHFENFGPASVQRNIATGAASLSTTPSSPKVAQHSVPVLFNATGKEARWKPDSGSLLELAEARGIEPEFSCRNGSCGTCRTVLEVGQVSYLNPPSYQCAPNEILPCCARPAQGSEKLVIRL